MKPFFKHLYAFRMLAVLTTLLFYAGCGERAQNSQVNIDTVRPWVSQIKFLSDSAQESLFVYFSEPMVLDENAYTIGWLDVSCASPPPVSVTGEPIPDSTKKFFKIWHGSVSPLRSGTLYQVHIKAFLKDSAGNLVQDTVKQWHTDL